jgi:selenocysteine-specific elongation factor
VLLEEPVVARAGDRFVLRLPSPAATIGGGVVTDPTPPSRRARPWPAGLGAAQRLEAALAEAGPAGIAAGSIAVRIGAPRSELEALMTGRSVAPLADGRLAARAVVEGLRGRLEAAVREHHVKHPLDEGAPLAALRTAVGAAGAAFDAVLRELAAASVITVHGAAVRVAGWTPGLGATDAALAARILEILAQSAKEPPSIAELATAVSAEPRPVLRFLERGGQVVAVADDRYYSAPAIATLVTELESAMLPGRVYSPAELRDALGLSRKYLIPFLEYCDRRGVTLRRDGGRVRAGT